MTTFFSLQPTVMTSRHTSLQRAEANAYSDVLFGQALLPYSSTWMTSQSALLLSRGSRVDCCTLMTSHLALLLRRRQPSTSWPGPQVMSQPVPAAEVEVQYLKGLSHENFRPIFWPVWMHLGLNVNRFCF
jgi:hypothetical protein